MKNLWKKWIFMAQYHFQDPDTDPDPAWQFESGSNRIRNTLVKYLGVLQKVPVLLLIQAAPPLQLRKDHSRVHRVHSDLLRGQLQSCTPTWHCLLRTKGA